MLTYAVRVILLIAYTGGKTGGHIIPLLQLISRSTEESIFLGQAGNLEEELCKKHNVSFIGFKGSKGRIRSGIKSFFFYCKSLKNIKIKALISSGGYISTGACLYAIYKRIPIYLLEENVIIGDFNRILYPFCKKIFWAYKPQRMKKKYSVTGLPIRNVDRIQYHNRYDVLIIGGSLGSRVLCDLAYMLPKKYRICLIAGRYYKEYSSTEQIDVISFSDDIYSLMYYSKIVISRAGASTTAEIFYMNRPFICIPSNRTKKNHQVLNAKYFNKAGACLLCYEENISKEIKAQIELLLENEAVAVNMLAAQRGLIMYNPSESIFKILKENEKK